MRAKRIPLDANHKTNGTPPYISRVCGLFVRDRSDLALIDLCDRKSFDETNAEQVTNEPTLFMASLGRMNSSVEINESKDKNDGMKIGITRNGSIVVIDFEHRTRFIRINVDDNEGISITLQVFGIFHINK